MTIKRSLSIRGHRTSITLEEAFWHRLNQLAGERAVSVAELVAGIDERRDPAMNLSSALRVHLLEDALTRLDAGADKDR